MRRVAVIAAAAAAVVLGGGGPASASPFLDPEDATSLAGVLEEASQAQGGVCYGWTLDLSDATGAGGVDSGSNRGVGPPPSQISDCTKYVELSAAVRWTSESSESEDTANFTVRVEGFPDGPTAADVRSTLGINGSDLKNDDGDVILYKAVATLPRLMADAGLVPSVTITPAASAPPGTEPTGSRSPDWVRQRQGLLALGGVLIGVAATMVVVALYVRRSDRRQALATRGRHGAGGRPRPSRPPRTASYPVPPDRPRTDQPRQPDQGAS